MKNLFTLFLISLTILSFGQIRKTQAPKQCKVIAHSIYAQPTSQSGIISQQRSSGTCDTSDWLDYNTYDELVATNAGEPYTGSLNVQQTSIPAWEISSTFVTVHSAQNQYFNYVMQAYDSLAFADFATYQATSSLAASVYTKTLKTSTITVDSLALEIGISGDTSANGLMANDSLAFTLYPIIHGNVDTTVATSHRISFVGLDAIAPFVTGTSEGSLILVQFPVTPVTFAQGQGFAVKVQYYNADTSSHCLIAFTYPDSCGTDPNLAASPSVLNETAEEFNTANYTGSAFEGLIDSVGPTTANILQLTNDFVYQTAQGQPLSPINCAFVYWQNWQIIAHLSVTNTLGSNINGANPLTLTCTGNPTRLLTTNSGDLGGVTYAWSSNVFGATSNSSTTIYNPGTYDITVTNSSGCQATAEVVASYASGINNTPSFTFLSQGPDNHICYNTPWLFTNTSSDLTGYTSLWHFQQGPDSITAVMSPTHTYPALGVYTITLVLDSAGCTFGTTQTVLVDNCTGIKDVTFESNVSILPNPSNGTVNVIVNGADKNVTLTVYNVMGQVVKTYATTESPSVYSQQLDLTNVSTGTYLLKIQSGSKMATKKLVITK